MTDSPKAHVALNRFDAEDTATLHVLNPVTKEPIGWDIVFAGPAHAQTVELLTRLERRRLQEAFDRANEDPSVKKAPRKPEDIRQENVETVADRIISWTAIDGTDGHPLLYSKETARAIMGDRRKSWLYAQALDFLSESLNFMKPSGAA